MNKNSNVYIAGHKGLVGSAILRNLRNEGYTNIITASSSELDLRNREVVDKFICENDVEYIFLAAAKVGGIKANSDFKGAFIYDNLMIQTNVIDSAKTYGIKKLLFLGSSCFPAGIVNTSEGYKDISKINIGDKVIDHNGELQYVNYKFEKEYNNKVFNIKILGVEKIISTPEHPFLIDNASYKEAKDLIIGDKLILPIYQSKNVQEYVDLITDNLEINKRLCYKEICILSTTELSTKYNLSKNIINAYKVKSVPRSLKIPDNSIICGKLAWLSGVFLAEGWISGKNDKKRGSKHSICFSPGYNEIFKNNIVEAIVGVFNVTPKVKLERTSWIIRIDDINIFSFFQQFYSEHIYNSSFKKIPNFIVNSNNQALIDFIRGYWEGDGCVHKRNNRIEQYTCVSSSVSYNLSYGINNILYKLGIFNSINFVKKKNKCVIENRVVNQKNQWSVRINGGWANKFIELIFNNNKIDYIGKDMGIIIENDRIILPITNISISQYNGIVYNLSVDDTHTYTINNVAVHNCIYPKLSPQPIKEEYLLTGPLETSNDAYAIAKIAGIKMCQSYNLQYKTNYISVMPTNLYGLGDNYHADNSHVIPGMISKIHNAKINNEKNIICWGDGSPKREFLFADDLAEACVFLMHNYNSSDIVNIGTGEDISIKDLANCIKDIIYPEGNIIFDNNINMNGTPRKLLDVNKLKTLGWSPKVSFIEGIKIAYSDYLYSLSKIGDISL